MAAIDRFPGGRVILDGHLLRIKPQSNGYLHNGENSLCELRLNLLFHVSISLCQRAHDPHNDINPLEVSSNYDAHLLYLHKNGGCVSEIDRNQE